MFFLVFPRLFSGDSETVVFPALGFEQEYHREWLRFDQDPRAAPSPRVYCLRQEEASATNSSSDAERHCVGGCGRKG